MEFWYWKKTTHNCFLHCHFVGFYLDFYSKCNCKCEIIAKITTKTFFLSTIFFSDTNKRNKMNKYAKITEWTSLIFLNVSFLFGIIFCLELGMLWDYWSFHMDISCVNFVYKKITEIETVEWVWILTNKLVVRTVNQFYLSKKLKQFNTSESVQF